MTIKRLTNTLKHNAKKEENTQPKNDQNRQLQIHAFISFLFKNTNGT